jgi:hypothetical protein
MHDSPETKAIRQRMEEVRGDLDTGFQGIVDDARDLGDWAYYLRNYPWAILGASVVAGYLIAPRLGFGTKQKNKPSERGAIPEASPAASPPLPPKSDFSGKVLAVAGNLALRGLTALVVQQADKLFTSWAAHSDQDAHR